MSNININTGIGYYNVNAPTNGGDTLGSDGSWVSASPTKFNNVKVTGDLTINGMSMNDWTAIVGSILSIPQRDVAMEAKYPALERKWDSYITAIDEIVVASGIREASQQYKEELEKYQNWESLKNVAPPSPENVNKADAILRMIRARKAQNP